MVPGFLRVVEDERDELDEWLFGFVSCDIGFARYPGARRSRPSTGQKREEVSFEDQAENEKNDDTADPQPHSAKAKSSATAAFVATILDIPTGSARCPTHRRRSFLTQEVFASTARQGISGGGKSLRIVPLRVKMASSL